MLDQTLATDQIFYYGRSRGLSGLLSNFHYYAAGYGLTPNQNNNIENGYPVTRSGAVKEIPGEIIIASIRFRKRTAH